MDEWHGESLSFSIDVSMAGCFFFFLPSFFSVPCHVSAFNLPHFLWLDISPHLNYICSSSQYMTPGRETPATDVLSFTGRLSYPVTPAS